MQTMTDDKQSRAGPTTSVAVVDKRLRCYVINLARDWERRARMEALLGDVQLDFTIVEAIRGDSLEPAELAFFESPEAGRLFPAELGCMISHLNCWRLFLESDAAFALICEDDIHISPQIRHCLDRLAFPQDANSIVRLESFGSFTTFDVKTVQTIGRYGVHKMLSDHGGAACYLLDRKCAQHLLDAAPKFKTAVDIEMFFPGRSTVPGLNVFQFIPALAIQDQILTANRSTGFLKSNMGKQRADVRIWNNRSLFQRLKGKARPYYQAAYSLCLRVTAGKMRVIVPFK